MEFGPLPAPDIIPFPGQHDEGTPRFLMSRHAGGISRFYRQDLPAELRARLAAVDPERVFADDGLVREILAAHAPCDGTWSGVWYRIEQAPDPAAYPTVSRVAGELVVLIDDKPVARAWSAKADARAEEVEVATDAAYRGRGYGRQVVAAWVSDVLARGKVAIYSHRIDNEPSRRIVEGLGGRQFSEEIEYA
jgi:ribosomal protein S18 acetylase RimI-like enzyme